MLHLSDISVPNREWSIKQVGNYFPGLEILIYLFFLLFLQVEQIQIFMILIFMIPIGPLISFPVKTNTSNP